uniref:CYCLIN domain-containing protein n=1 Tax=Syphacia muris TaxID=451379 RepID=A0A0N5AZ10_9BILA
MDESAVPSWYLMLNTLIRRERLRTDVFNCLPVGKSLTTEEDRSHEAAWIVNACRELGLGIDTMCLAAITLDRVLLSKRVQTKYVNCVATACLSLAIKFCEESLTGADHLIASLNLPYSVRELNRMERTVLNALKWDLDVPSAYRFIEAMLVSAGFSPATDKARSYLENMFRFPLEAVIRSSSLNFKFRPSVLALTLYSLFLDASGSPFWEHITIGLQRLLKVRQEEMIECWEAIADVMYAEEKENAMAAFDNDGIPAKRLSDAQAIAKMDSADGSSLFKAKSGRCMKKKITSIPASYALAFLSQQD